MFNETFKKLLEDFNIFPRSGQPLGQGPNIDFTGAQPAGFLGGGLPGVNPSASVPLKIKKAKKKSKKVKKR